MKEPSAERGHVLAVLEHAVESANDAFVTIDQDHKVLIFNKAAEKIFGYDREEVVGRDLDVIMAPTCSRDHRRAVDRYVRTRVPTRIGHATELTAVRKSGEFFPASISFSVTEVEERLFFTGIVRDMTETRALQDRIIQSERLAALGRLVAEITHEIKNPLMVIGGFARQLIRAAREDGSLKKLTIISSEVERLENLLKDLREIYLPVSPLSDVVDLKGVLREVEAMVEDVCSARGIRLDLSMDDLPLLTSGEEGRLKQIFLNLVRNAVEAMEKGGRLSISAQLKGDRVEATVSDEGPGISEENRKKIFTPFFTTKRNGTGLGLCVSKRIIEEQLGGSIALESPVGQGARFIVSLPSHQGSTEEA